MKTNKNKIIQMKVLSIVDFESEQENLDSKIEDAILYNEQLTIKYKCDGY